MASLTDDQQETLDAFTSKVNMTPTELEEWLQTDESKEVGDRDDGESTGHASGRRIVELLRKNKDEYDEDDLSHMSKVVGYINRHTSQEPSGDVEDSRWRYSLMNWGHDPLK